MKVSYIFNVKYTKEFYTTTSCLSVGPKPVFGIESNLGVSRFFFSEIKTSFFFKFLKNFHMFPHSLGETNFQKA